LSVKVQHLVFEGAKGITGNDRVVLLVLADHANDDGTAAYPSHQTIARKAGGIEERTVRYCLKRLLEADIIGREGWSPLHTISYEINLATLAGLPAGTNLANSRNEPGNRPPVPKNRPVTNHVPSEHVVDPSDSVQHLYEVWLQATGRNGNTRLTPERRRKLQARLRTYPVDEIERAICNVATDPFHSGDNDSGRRYDDLELICRNDTKLEEYRDMERKGGTDPLAAIKARGAKAAAELAAEEAMS
jgi:hypothetical protein